MNRVAAYRIFRIVWMALKFYLQITLFRKRHQGSWDPLTMDQWNRLVTGQAKEYKKLAQQLGGLLIKVGQFLSTRADIMPPTFLAELEGLTDRVPSISRGKIVDVIETEWNAPYTQYLMSLADEVTASASIGEVYKGVLKDGSEVAIKVQRPGTEHIIHADFQAFAFIMWFFRKFTPLSRKADLPALYREMVRTIGNELDFKEELKSGRSFADRFGTMPGIRIPNYYEELSTRKVLVMEWIEGSRITDTAFIEKNGLNRQILAERLFLLFLEQVLNGGEFHADPHGGNILISPDGTITLIDFGMTGVITQTDAQAGLRIAEGIIFKNYDQVLDALEELGFLLPNAERPVLKEAISRTVKMYESSELFKMDSLMLQQLLEDLQELVLNQPVQLPAEFAFFGRAASTFVGVLYVLDPNVDLLGLARPRVLEWANSQEAGGRIFGREDVVRWVLNTTGPIRSLPQKVADILEEPERYRHYMERRDELDREWQRILQTRAFAGSFGLLSFASLSAAVWFEHEAVIWVSGVFLLGSLWTFRTVD
ncbi:ABC1 kinase family protein [Indiicoccus explosivorum]|uniref:ABC1 kinase family protein n=1 Tax=Indiicoccus explosivorum TaxID=1917864 RepID=UPI000B446D64|nr:AarF/UbiB family protein [Indiicoccus explosivorum]